MDFHDYDMIWAVTQDAVNNQLRTLFDLGVIQSAVKVGHGFKQLDAIIDAPTVAFDTGEATRAKMSVKFLEKSTLALARVGEDANGGPIVVKENKNIDNWGIVFDVKLNIAALASHKELPDEVQKRFTDKLENFDDSMFSVKQLLLDFQSTDQLGSMKITGPENEAPETRAAINDVFGLWLEHLKKGPPWILGFAAERKKFDDVRAKAVFSPSGVNFSSRRYEPSSPETAGRSTLNYLLTTDGRRPTIQPTEFGRNLVEEKNYQGRVFITNHIFSEQYLKPKIFAPLLKVAGLAEDNLQVNGSANKWHYHSDEKVQGAHNTDTTKTRDVTFALVNRTSNQVRLTIAGASYDEWHQDHYHNLLLGDVKFGWSYVKGWLNWDATLDLTAGDNGTIVLEHNLDVKDPKVTNTTSDFQIVMDTLNGQMDETKRGLDAVKSSVSGGFLRAVADLGQAIGSMNELSSVVVMPGGQTFAYNSIQISETGDLEMALVYSNPV